MYTLIRRPKAHIVIKDTKKTSRSLQFFPLFIVHIKHSNTCFITITVLSYIGAFSPISLPLACMHMLWFCICFAFLAIAIYSDFYGYLKFILNILLYFLVLKFSISFACCENLLLISSSKSLIKN